VLSMLDFLTYSLCDPYSETTLGEQFDQLLEMVAKRAAVFFHLFQHPAGAVVKGAGLVMKSVIEVNRLTAPDLTKLVMWSRRNPSPRWPRSCKSAR